MYNHHGSAILLGYRQVLCTTTCLYIGPGDILEDCARGTGKTKGGSTCLMLSPVASAAPCRYHPALTLAGPTPGAGLWVPCPRLPVPSQPGCETDDSKGWSPSQRQEAINFSLFSCCKESTRCLSISQLHKRHKVPLLEATRTQLIPFHPDSDVCPVGREPV
jgi:hypothetical protein